MKRLVILVAAVVGAAVLSTSVQAGERNEGSKAVQILDSYCNPSGDYCLRVVGRGNKVKLEISSFAFSGEYELCVRGPDGKTCRTYTLAHEDGGGYSDQVGVLSQFGYQGPGIYRVTWKVNGKALKKTLGFQYG